MESLKPDTNKHISAYFTLADQVANMQNDLSKRRELLVEEIEKLKAEVKKKESELNDYDDLVIQLMNKMGGVAMSLTAENKKRGESSEKKEAKGKEKDDVSGENLAESYLSRLKSNNTYPSQDNNHKPNNKVNNDDCPEKHRKNVFSNFRNKMKMYNNVSNNDLPLKFVFVKEGNGSPNNGYYYTAPLNKGTLVCIDPICYDKHGILLNKMCDKEIHFVKCDIRIREMMRSNKKEVVTCTRKCSNKKKCDAIHPVVSGNSGNCKKYPCYDEFCNYNHVE